jgi:hypothetical protein
MFGEGCRGFKEGQGVQSVQSVARGRRPFLALQAARRGAASKASSRGSAASLLLASQPVACPVPLKEPVATSLLRRVQDLED